MNNPLSYSSVKLDLLSKDDVRLRSVSGFVVESGRNNYLITNWHVLAGTDTPTGTPQEIVPKPYVVKTTLHIHGGQGEKSALFFAGMRKKITVPLYDENDRPTWIEHQANQQNEHKIDIVALPIRADLTLRLFSGYLPGITVSTGSWSKSTDYWAKISAIPFSAIDMDVEYGPPDTVFIVGYPLGWAPEGTDRSSSAFWRTSFIAAEIYEAGTIRSNTFYVDPCAPAGMTGSPVIGLKKDRLRLLGVYSDRSTAEFGANAGLVWNAALLKELIGAA